MGFLSGFCKHAPDKSAEACSPSKQTHVYVCSSQKACKSFSMAVFVVGRGILRVLFLLNLEPFVKPVPFTVGLSSERMRWSYCVDRSVMCLQFIHVCVLALPPVKSSKWMPGVFW